MQNLILSEKKIRKKKHKYFIAFMYVVSLLHSWEYSQNGKALKNVLWISKFGILFVELYIFINNTIIFIFSLQISIGASVLCQKDFLHIKFLLHQANHLGKSDAKAEMLIAWKHYLFILRSRYYNSLELFSI